MSEPAKKPTSAVQQVKIKPLVDIKVPYYCQYDNELYKGGSCNMTSAAMVLSFYGKKVPGRSSRVPDNLLNYCDANGLDRHELQVIDQVLEKYGVRDDSGYNITFKQIKEHLSSGNIVIVQGNFTPSGHIIVVSGYNSEKGLWLCYDPAGRWYGPEIGYHGPRWQSGEHVWYPSDWFRKAAAPDGDGLVWAHLCSDKSKAAPAK